jgi:hypothetical protein
LFPHVPLEAIPIGTGIGCVICGMAPPMFTCLFCFTMQHLFVQPQALAFAAMGMHQMTPQVQLPQLAQALQQQGLKVAPVVNAPQGTGDGVIKGMMKDVAKTFGTTLGEGLAKQLLGAFFGGG